MFLPSLKLTCASARTRHSRLTYEFGLGRRVLRCCENSGSRFAGGVRAIGSVWALSALCGFALAADPKPLAKVKPVGTSDGRAPVEAPATMRSSNDDEADANDVHRTYLELLRSDERFPSAETCAQCHPDHYREWSVSPHAYAMLSPVFNAMQMFVADETAGTNGDFCIRCHSPVALQREEKPHLSVLVRPPVSNEGVTCIVCHRIESDYGTASGRLPLQEGNLLQPVYGPTGAENLKKALADDEFGLVTSAEETGKRVHTDVIKFSKMRASAFCAGCHDVNSPNGFRLESAFTQYKNAPASRDGESCQDCHMGVTPGSVYDGKDRFGKDGRDLNYHWGPAAKVKASVRDPREGLPTPDRRRTNHMFIGPDYSVVHPGLFPHSLEARELTYGQRFNDTARREIEAYLKKYEKPTPDQRAAAKNHAMQLAEESATEHVLTDWLKFRWWEGWGTPEFEKDLDEKKRQQLLAGVGFPWEDEDKSDEAQLRRQVARLILNRQFNLLNEAHVERVRILRRGYQLRALEFRRNTQSSLDFAVKIINATDGHGTPTGFDAERLVFLETTVTDANGRVLMKSGDRDPNGDVRDLHSAYVHHHAKKDGEWLGASRWKEASGLPLLSHDQHWEPDPFLFSLQTKFLTRNVYGGEREQVIAVNYSADPLPYVRPEPFATNLLGRPAGARKHVMILPPNGHRWAEYHLGQRELSGARPYRVQVRFIAQMVPVNLVKTISPMGFDYQLSAKEVAKRVAYGHPTTPSKEDHKRRGGAITLWNLSVPVPDSGGVSTVGFSAVESTILDVPVKDYPFPHTTEEDLKKMEESLQRRRPGDGSSLDKLQFNPPGVILWPGLVPPGIPFIPPNEPIQIPLGPLPAPAAADDEIESHPLFPSDDG